MDTTVADASEHNEEEVEVKEQAQGEAEGQCFWSLHRVEDIKGIRARAEDLAKPLLLVDRESVEGILEVANQNSNS